MSKLIVLFIGVLATLFPIKADYLLYSFSGTTNEEVIGNFHNSNMRIPVSYQIIVDWDGDAFLNGEIKNDVNQSNLIGDFGTFALDPSSSLYYDNDALTYSTLYAQTMRVKKYNQWTTSNTSFVFEGFNSLGENTNVLLFQSSSYYLSVGATYLFEEEHREDGINHLIWGYSTLNSITSYDGPFPSTPVSSTPSSPSSVPEPHTAILLFSGVVVLSCFRKKSEQKKC